jgi:hypothetical protein
LHIVLCMQLAQEEEAEAAQATERAAAREAAYAQQAAQHSVRVDALGSDRHHRCYYALQHANDLIWVDSGDGEKVGVLHRRDQLEALAARLLERGPREKELAAVLELRKAELLAGLAEDAHPHVARGFRLQDMAAKPAPPPLPAAAAAIAAGALPAAAAAAAAEPQLPANTAEEELEARAEAATIEKGLGYVATLCDTLIATETGVAECTELKGKLQGVQGFDQFIAVRLTAWRHSRRLQACHISSLHAAPPSRPVIATAS